MVSLVPSSFSISHFVDLGSEKLDGTRDTIEARDYWIMSPDSQLIKFEINDSLKIIYNKDGVTSFRKIF